MRNGKRVSAVVSGAAALTVLAAGAMSAFAFDTVDLEDRTDELAGGVLNIVADEVYADPGETVEYRVLIHNNTGYADSGVAIKYDPQLTVKTTDGKADIKTGDGAYGLTPSDGYNEEKYLIGIGTIGVNNCTQDGTMFSVSFTVPEDAQPGTEYPMALKVTKILDNKTKAVAYEAVDGWIRIRTEETTAPVTTTKPIIGTTTAPVTTKPIATTTKPATTSPISTTTKENETTKVDETTVTSAEPISDTTDANTTSSEISTSTNIGSDVTTSISTKKTDRNPGNVTAPNNGSNGSKSSGAKTGDTGTGVAAAALLLAGASAAIASRKKKN